MTDQKNIQTRKLSQEEFKATQINPKKVEAGEPPFDFWAYVGSIPAEDFGEFDCRDGNVGHVYRMDDLYEHVLVQSQYEGIAMVIVLDLKQQTVYGHYMLDIRPRGQAIL